MINCAASAGRLFLTVNRRLVVLTCAYLAGIYLTHWMAFPFRAAGILCAFLSVWAVLRLMRRKSALFCMAVLLLLLGNLRAGSELAVRDEPTPPATLISGRIYAVEKPYRVYLTDIVIGEEEERLEHAVLVTLIRETNEHGNAVADAPQAEVGQRVSGVGRLFAPEESRNPGGINRRISALCDGYELSGYILPGWTAEGEKAFSLRDLFRRLRERLIAHIERLFGDQAAVFMGVMLGDKSGVDDGLMNAMRLTGTVHILTVSGMHLGMIGVLLAKVLRRLPVRRFIRFALFGAVLACFALLTGGAPGTVRALIMTLLREWAQMRGRRYEPLTGLSSAAFVMALIHPLWPLDGSFQFSFFIVLGILLLAPSLAYREGSISRWPHWVRRMVGMLSVSCSAQLAALPMQLLFYGYVPLLSLPMNLLCGAVMPLLLFGGWANAALGALWLDAGLGVGGLLAVFVEFFAAVSEWAAGLEGSILRLPAPYGVSVFACAALMALLSRRICFGRMRVRAAAVLTCFIALLYLPRFCPASRYVQLDVGQGDGALFRSGRHAVLIDVGPADSYDMLRYLRHEGLFVDAVILSHLDEDHAGALGVLLDSEIGLPSLVLADGALGDALFHDADDRMQETEISAAVQSALVRLQAEGIRTERVASGDHLSVCGVEMDVLLPPRGQRSEGDNEGSLLLYAKTQGVEFLLTGDLPAEMEPAFVPDCDILKAAHHGSKNATSSAFLNMAAPEATIISAGAGNAYGHPHERVLSDLEAVGSEILRTDERGCITLWLRDGRWREESFLSD